MLQITTLNHKVWLISLCLAVLTAQAISTRARGEAVTTVTADDVHALVQAKNGKVVVLNFWASWCPPCLKEFPDIIKVYNEYHSEGLEMMAVSMNAADEMEDIDEFLQNYEPPFPVHLAASLDEAFYEGVVKPWFGEIPITLIFDADGELVHVHKKPLTYEELVTDVTALLP